MNVFRVRFVSAILIDNFRPTRSSGALPYNWEGASVDGRENVRFPPSFVLIPVMSFEDGATRSEFRQQAALGRLELNDLFTNMRPSVHGCPMQDARQLMT